MVLYSKSYFQYQFLSVVRRDEKKKPAQLIYAILEPFFNL